MFNFIKKVTKPAKADRFDKYVLRNNDISILILDERWNGLFKDTEKTVDIIRVEEELKNLLIIQSRLLEEQRSAGTRKKELVARILSLTQETFENNNESAREKMDECEQEIKKLNERIPEVEKEIDELPRRIKEKNLELLSIAVEQIYFTLRGRQKRLEEIERLIQEEREKLQGYIEEKHNLSQENSDSYSYFHDLLGSDELERLDKLYFDDSDK